MAYIVYVDLSAKIEQWNRASAVAMANGTTRVIWVPSKVKQRSRRMLLERYGSQSVRYRMLAVLVYLVVKDDLQDIRQIVIDQDYSGRQVEATIRNVLLHLLRREKPNVSAGFVRFEKVARSNADILAKQVYDGKGKPDREVNFAEIKNLLKGK